ncbi:Pentatricopeptide repeat-containing protein [Ananas comosus]|uniref:Pentatricopeptide repeat-containing protein n=1 Tax=Ananas comosus TaxID=4615 RepID=A0A199VDY8_ANACO|nr:Pentatricopeptide repeat-containing protein [Ananas comosus]
MTTKRRLAKSLPSLIAKHRRLTEPDPEPPAAAAAGLPLEALLEPEPSLPPLLSLPLSHLSPAPPAALARFVGAHLPSPSFSSGDLLRLLRRRLRHHPRLSPYDLRVLLWASSSLDSFRPDHALYSFLARSLASSARAPQLALLLRRVLSHPCPCADASVFACPHLEPTFRAALPALCRAGLLHDAAHLLRALRRALDARPAPALYNALLHGFARAARHADALRLFDEMTRRDRVRPDACTFNILIASACRSSGVASALPWLRRMTSAGCRPGVVTFNTLIGAFFREKKFAEGVGIAREMLDLGTGFSVATCEILADGLCKEGRVIEAVDLLTEFLASGALPEGFDCSALIKSLCREGELERASELFDLVWEKRRSSLSVVTCTTLMEGLRKFGNLDAACGLMERMIEEGLVPDTITCNCLLEALCDAGKTLDANRLRVLASKKGFEPDGVTFSILVRGFSREGKGKEGEAGLSNAKVEQLVKLVFGSVGVQVE